MRNKLIDYIKGWAIILIIINHIINWFYLIKDKTFGIFYESVFIFVIIQAVPLLILISGYFFNKKLENTDNPIKTQFSIQNIQKLIKLIIIPAIITSLIIMFIRVYIKQYPFHLNKFIQAGFIYGSGSYYIIFYLQLWVLAPFVVFLKRKIPNFYIQLLLLIVCEIIIVNCYIYFNFPEWLYRLLFIRHSMLFFLGMSFDINNLFNFIKEKIYDNMYINKYYYIYFINYEI